MDDTRHQCNHRGEANGISEVARTMRRCPEAQGVQRPLQESEESSERGQEEMVGWCDEGSGG